MRNTSRLAAIVSGGIVAATLAACSTTTTYPVSTVPVTTYPTAPMNTPVAGLEYGRVTNIEYMPVGTTANNNRGVLGAIVGGVAGAVLGSTIGGGSGRTAATVVGGVAGAAIGNSIARNQAGATTMPGYRITVQTDQGYMRDYEVSATGDLHVGDRVRVDNGVIYRG
ncbi:glycine zipper 2TM domain-containing protein [Ramlibacter sp.]|uniref:glycine zipper 2TM domain-containing protein n=1 Tax=Ramlibacter sp. TaxID=1917967 RepID=UPI001849770A|nr:glycine zipper 2TM domain-containing protein [Ramlibacter sp.]MBA2675509.1 glycine zipper 2TM domain-containing protein [Ramlibacter sp.]